MLYHPIVLATQPADMVVLHAMFVECATKSRGWVGEHGFHNPRETVLSTPDPLSAPQTPQGDEVIIPSPVFEHHNFLLHSNLAKPADDVQSTSGTSSAASAEEKLVSRSL